MDFAVNDPVGFVDDDSLREELAAGRLRPEWSWFAVDGSRIVARALWWGREDSEYPIALDCLHVLADVPNRAELAAELMSIGHNTFCAKPEYVLVVPTAKQDADSVADAVAWRREAAQAAGLTETIERLRFEWTPADGVPTPSDRLVFRPASDDDFLAIFQRVTVGSLDVATQGDIAATDTVSQAQDDLAFYRSCPGERSWWRLAEDTDGTLVGFAIPSATPYHRNVGYLWVVPELRGHSYVDDILGEITRVHAADGATRITATTDVPNKPMAAAFKRANYQVTEVRMVFEVPAG
ncbi:GNAT family N-acetyltransferase [Rhodococcus sp. 14-2686-1-2]|nr:GNAT family N-acetyltransferase [Rhodococcus sp. 15-1189-1-1a]OZF08327.1 GNAT family N-acetyltransferase [Rhodococcus sp. 14-2686-1-2]